MYALRERRQHVTQEDFEFAVAKVRASSFPPPFAFPISVVIPFFQVNRSQLSTNSFADDDNKKVVHRAKILNAGQAAKRAGVRACTTLRTYAPNDPLSAFSCC